MDDLIQLLDYTKTNPVVVMLWMLFVILMVIFVSRWRLFTIDRSSTIDQGDFGAVSTGGGGRIRCAGSEEED
jgi:hypothetical protein